MSEQACPCISEHRQGNGRQWCYDCGEWCYLPDGLCVRGEVITLQAENTRLSRVAALTEAAAAHAARVEAENERLREALRDTKRRLRWHNEFRQQLQRERG